MRLGDDEGDYYRGAYKSTPGEAAVPMRPAGPDNLARDEGSRRS